MMHVGSTTRASVETAQQTRIELARERASQEIERRIDVLTALDQRVQEMRRISSTVKASIASSVEGQIANLTELKGNIEADTDLETLRTDIHSITGSYRIFALIVPQARIIVAADKVKTTAALMSDFADKLQVRISAAQTSGNDVTELSRLLADMNAKIADAEELADAALALITGLQPDNGDKTVQEANSAALREARVKIQAALADLHTAREDAGAIVKGLHSLRFEDGVDGAE